MTTETLPVAAFDKRARSRRGRRGLHNDTRGAVMVIGVFMAAFLVGALWYIIGIGNAAVYREYMQDGADAVSFASAVYHARGMNVIVLINLIMAAVLAVLVAFKIAQLLLWITNGISCVFGAFLDPVCDATTAAEPEMSSLVTEVENGVDTMLRVLKRASDAVAVGMPLVAEAKAVIVAGDYQTTVKNGFMVSVSMLPGDGITGGGGRYGLPVQDDKFSNLCGKAGLFVVDLVFLPFDLIPGAGTIIGGVKHFAGGMVSTLTKTFPAYFCGGGPVVSLPGVGGKSPSEDKDACNAEKAALTDPAAKKAFDMAKCIKNRVAIRAKTGGAKAMDGGSDRTSKALLSAARMGDDYFGVYGFTFGDLSNQSDANKGVNVAGWGTKAGDPDVWGKVQFAKSEFYYEPSTKVVDGISSGKTDQSSVASDCMWNMRWRARLRRFRIPSPEMTGFLFPLVGKIGDGSGGWAVKSVLKSVLKSSTVTGILNDPAKGIIGALTDDIIIH